MMTWENGETWVHPTMGSRVWLTNNYDCVRFHESSSEKHSSAGQDEQKLAVDLFAHKSSSQIPRQFCFQDRYVSLLRFYSGYESP
jgi:hypothetical protein